MSFFEDNASFPPDQEPSALSPTEKSPGEGQPPAPTSAPPIEIPLAGDPISFAARVPAASASYAFKRALPEDLRIPWSWLHLVLFLFFGFFSLILIQGAFAVYYAPLHHFTNEKEFERFVLSKPAFAIGSMVLWYAFIFLFLYVTLSVLRGLPFWRTLGWRSITRADGGPPRSLWIYFLGGCMLSILVFGATAKMQQPENVPIEELFRYKNTALLFMAMAVLVAPLVEETVFRGYLYPLLAKYFGVATSVIVTGVLFGLMHGAQLGWTWGLVSVLIIVGIIFTFARARTGSVFASFLLHLGYNSMIAAVSILGTQGFTKIPGTH
ncbi:MAG TPA: CPBP family intramembrane glutamic endopeptidase [Candidatus Solibacter sp.]|nr:CPBP family intramembrane glutamic endopeptidase [Candidatus Solibacter sp.]